MTADVAIKNSSKQLLKTLVKTVAGSAYEEIALPARSTVLIAPARLPSPALVALALNGFVTVGNAPFVAVGAGSVALPFNILEPAVGVTGLLTHASSGFAFQTIPSAKTGYGFVMVEGAAKGYVKLIVLPTQVGATSAFIRYHGTGAAGAAMTDEILKDDTTITITLPDEVPGRCHYFSVIEDVGTPTSLGISITGAVS